MPMLMSMLMVMFMLIMLVLNIASSSSAVNLLFEDGLLLGDLVLGPHVVVAVAARVAAAVRLCRVVGVVFQFVEVAAPFCGCHMLALGE